MAITLDGWIFLLVIDLNKMKDSQTELTHVLESSVEVTEVLIKVSECL